MSQDNLGRHATKDEGQDEAQQDQVVVGKNV
jgi:hypothetical protein